MLNQPPGVSKPFRRAAKLLAGAAKSLAGMRREPKVIRQTRRIEPGREACAARRRTRRRSRWPFAPRATRTMDCPRLRRPQASSATARAAVRQRRDRRAGARPASCRNSDGRRSASAIGRLAARGAACSVRDTAACPPTRERAARGRAASNRHARRARAAGHQRVAPRQAARRASRSVDPLLEARAGKRNDRIPDARSSRVVARRCRSTAKRRRRSGCIGMHLQRRLRRRAGRGAPARRGCAARSESPPKDPGADERRESGARRSPFGEAAADPQRRLGVGMGQHGAAGLTANTSSSRARRPTSAARRRSTASAHRSKNSSR